MCNSLVSEYLEIRLQPILQGCKTKYDKYFVAERIEYQIQVLITILLWITLIVISCVIFLALTLMFYFHKNSTCYLVQFFLIKTGWKLLKNENKKNNEKDEILLISYRTYLQRFLQNDFGVQMFVMHRVKLYDFGLRTILGLPCKKTPKMLLQISWLHVIGWWNFKNGTNTLIIVISWLGTLLR